ncbi:hypothetical protein SHK09_15405 [Polaribacter sp. PL03]|uniref:hypothetical protein n=1 Tax=Polaribacter sp. PL03 TaxID=3088353 RepID=UPI0029CF04C5|nr:hypothetical protein [Polaribacter sp. PL03]MDX6748183.1 hypothetical protein [Polaribacter sp. PL03]
MKKNFLLLFIPIILLSCGSYKPKKSLTLSVFENLENLKCKNNGIDEYLLNSGYFKSYGTVPSKFGPPARMYITFEKFRKEFIIVGSYNQEQYNFSSFKPVVYNFIRKNGTFVETVTMEKTGITNLKYKLNNSTYLLEIEENVIDGRSSRLYKILSWCR